ncbi:hypothetical protein [Trichocoleus sp. FACHB-591]|uniref:hypothetical protein n=1 Tax=Trichocoleus sp. FACHB-591 TaxID=2692872 RepID=UPI0016840A50|nr:hypothetical protein [Trichocoleus sp. FACHB-591]
MCLNPLARLWVLATDPSVTRTRCMNRDRSQPPILLKQRGLQAQPLKFLLPPSLPQAPFPNANP